MDALDWVSCDGFDLLGRALVVRTTSAPLAEHVRRFLRSFPPADPRADLTLSIACAPDAEGATAEREFVVYRDGAIVGRAGSTWQVLRLLEWQIDLFLADSITDLVLLHAGAVSWNGAGVLLPGRSASGKSSLTLALLLHGWGYLSDELAVIDASGREVLAFPKPVSCKDPALFPNLAGRRDVWLGAESRAEGAVWYVHPDDLGSAAVGRTAPIRYVIFPRYQRGAATALCPIPAGPALHALLENSVNLRRSGERTLPILARLARQAACFSLTTSSLAGAVDGLTRLIGR